MFYHAPSGNPISKADKTFTFFGTGDETLVYTTVDNLAAYTIQAISEPNAADGGVYYVESFRCSNRDMARTYDQVRGTKLELKNLGSVSVLESFLDHSRATFPPTEFMKYNGLAFGKHLLKGSLNFEASDSQRFGGVKQTSLTEWLQQNPDV